MRPHSRPACPSSSRELLRFHLRYSLVRSRDREPVATGARRRLEYSPLLGVWCARVRLSDELVHAWAFEDANEWQRIRREVIAKGIWPPPPSAESSQALLRQTSVVGATCALFAYPIAAATAGKCDGFSLARSCE